MTSSRRVSPIPQLKCVGPSSSVCKLHPIETMRCTNQGYDYDEEDIQWSCTASLPSELKLGATDVICEGYRNADDKWVLKGSCGVEYRLLLTNEGEKRFGHQHGGARYYMRSGIWAKIRNILFFAVFVGVLLFILSRIIAERFRPGQNRQRGNNGPGWPWGGGGGGGGDGDDPRGPPPPYDYNPGYRSKPSSSNTPSGPGFWTGALGGAAAGYLMGRRGQGDSSAWGRGSGPSFRRYDDPGEGSSGSPPRFSSSGPSTGFGSTRRR